MPPLPCETQQLGGPATVEAKPRLWPPLPVPGGGTRPVDTVDTVDTAGWTKLRRRPRPASTVRGQGRAGPCARRCCTSSASSSSCCSPWPGQARARRGRRWWRSARGGRRGTGPARGWGTCWWTGGGTTGRRPATGRRWGSTRASRWPTSASGRSTPGSGTPGGRWRCSRRPAACGRATTTPTSGPAGCWTRRGSGRPRTGSSRGCWRSARSGRWPTRRCVRGVDSQGET